MTNRIRQSLVPLVYLSDNWLSLAGVVLVTTSGLLWLLMLPHTLFGAGMQNPYLGILIYLMLPGAFFASLVLIPVGILIRRRKLRRAGPLETPLTIDFRRKEVRHLAAFFLVTSAANVIIASQFTYSAINYMDSVTFCGLTCHTVMQPEYSAYQNSPHSRVECVGCHIGPGASWFVKSKLSGVRQVFAVTFHTYSTPIPTPVRNLRPARETCEACHWPAKFTGDRLQVMNKFNDDQTNTPSKTVLLMHIGGGNGRGIHGMHVGPGITIRYASDESRQNIPWVSYQKGSAEPVTYMADGFKPEKLSSLSTRVMDCMDCHNRPSHTFQLPERAVDGSLNTGAISPTLPFAKKQSVAILKGTYASADEAAAKIPAAFEAFYKDTYPAVYAQRQAEVQSSAKALLAIFNRNVFPAMKVTWGSYPNDLGHTDFPGCFRCHDDAHSATGGIKITQDCNACHGLLAMEEAAPKILNDLGYPTAPEPSPGGGKATSPTK
ncbi:MAG TPA: NapC/NirT family cytochrome c [Bryobacteraceae bacterium]|nr:NapC/NirT family cytochrome c [Bryobacteraceae bacterium]